MAEKIIYTLALKKVSYSSQYPNGVEFGIPPGGYIYVGQSQGGISPDGQPLQSEGFAQCSALILKNSQTLESALFHIDDINLNYKQTPIVDQLVRNYIAGLDLDQTEKETLPNLISAAARFWNLKTFTDRPYGEKERQAFKARMAELNHEGALKACFILGDTSRDVKGRVMGELLSYFGIDAVEEIIVKTGQYHWGIAYKPQESTVLVNAEKQKKVLSYLF